MLLGRAPGPDVALLGTTDHALLRAPSADLASAARRRAFEQLAAGHHSVKLHLTTRCNLRCRNCYNDSSQGYDLAWPALERLLEGLRGRPCRLDLLGGEPTLHPRLAEVVRLARADIGIPSVFLYTNATGIDGPIAHHLAEAGLDTAIVSLHADEPSVHEQLTGIRGSFAHTCRGIDSLVAAGVRTYTFSIACSVNADVLARMTHFAAHRGVGALFFPYVPQREGDDLVIEEPDRLRRTLRFIIESSYVYRSSIVRALTDGSKLCPAFTRTVTVLANGTVTPCPFVGLPLGNVHDRPLEDILVDAHRNPALAELLADPEECRDCRILGVCGGGCKAGRYTVGGELRRRDANCLHGPYRRPVSVAELPGCLPYVY